jgi:hypothetical protein
MAVRRVLLLSALLLACGSSEQDRWEGFVYPDRDDLTRHRVIGTFSSMDECLSAVREEAGPEGAYECGLNCRAGSDGLSVCERTVD